MVASDNWPIFPIHSCANILCIVLWFAWKIVHLQYRKQLSDKKESGQTYNITVDGKPADLKCITGGAGNIVKYATKALRRQGGKAVVFQIPSNDQKYYKAFNDAKDKLEYEGKIYFYIAEEKILKEIK